MFHTLHCNQIGGYSSTQARYIHSTERLQSRAEVNTDAEGIQSSSLRTILEQWPAGKPKPKVLYTVPVSDATTPNTRYAMNYIRSTAATPPG